MTRLRSWLLPCFAATILVCVLYGQRPFREYPGWEYSDFPRPPDWQVPGEWAFARLMYPPLGGIYGPRRASVDSRQGYSNWTIDYPRSDRQLPEAVRRFAWILPGSVAQPAHLGVRDEGYN